MTERSVAEIYCLNRATIHESRERQFGSPKTVKWKEVLTNWTDQAKASDLSTAVPQQDTRFRQLKQKEGNINPI